MFFLSVVSADSDVADLLHKLLSSLRMTQRNIVVLPALFLNFLNRLIIDCLILVMLFPDWMIINSGPHPDKINNIKKVCLQNRIYLIYNVLLCLN